jgi:mannose-1-phosphate guanylyltransferase/mannose-1-phosphate guanylyltransferase/mannose-6-phosphate isomerase
MSRERLPRQFLALASRGSLFEDTVRRVADESRFAAPVVVSSEAHRFLIAEQLRHIGVEPFALVVEPCRRNTAPAAAVAAVMLGERDPDALMFLLPSNHVILDEAAFQAAVEVAAGAARTGAMVTFGITPPRPETGYGYIRRGAARGETTLGLISDR